MRSQIKTKKEKWKAIGTKKTHSFLANIEEGSDNAKVKEKKKTAGMKGHKKWLLMKNADSSKKKKKKRVKAIKMLLFYKKLEKNMLLIFEGKYQRRILGS
jgi:hypothetical protein